MAFDECIEIFAQGDNPNSLRWLEPPGSCLDTSSCGSNQICDFSAESADPVDGAWIALEPLLKIVKMLSIRLA